MCLGSVSIDDYVSATPIRRKIQCGHGIEHLQDTSDYSMKYRQVINVVLRFI